MKRNIQVKSYKKRDETDVQKHIRTSPSWKNSYALDWDDTHKTIRHNQKSKAEEDAKGLQKQGYKAKVFLVNGKYEIWFKE